MRRLTLGLLAGGVAAIAIGAVVVLLAFPRWFSLVVLVLVVIPTGWQLRRPLDRRLAMVASEARIHTTVEMAIRGLLLTWSAAAMDGPLARATTLFYALLLTGSRLSPRLIDRLAAARMRVAALPGAQELQDRMRLFDSVSQSSGELRRQIRERTNQLEVVAVAVVVSVVFGWDARHARWALVALAILAAVTLVIEAATLILSVAGRANAHFHEQVVQSLAEYAPEYILYFSAPASAVYQIRQWLPHLMALPRRFVIITRETGLVPRIAEFAPDVPVIASPRLTLLDSLVVDSARAVFYVNNGMRNAHMLRHTHLRHVQMLHGESDKAPSVNKFARAYDQLYVAGQAAIDRYAAYGVPINPSAFRIVGRPQADEVSTAGPDGRPTVLYAPTWEGWNTTRTESSVGVLGVELVRRLLARGDVRVIVRPHPTTGLAARALRQDVAVMRSLVESAGGDHVWSAPDGDLTLVDCFNMCTAMIADISSVMADFLRSEKPLIVTDVDGLGPDQVRESFPTAAAAWILEPGASNIDDIMSDVLGVDSLRDDRRRVRHYVLGDFDGPAEPIFHEAMTASIDERLHDLPAGAEEISA